MAFRPRARLSTGLCGPWLCVRSVPAWGTAASSRPCWNWTAPHWRPLSIKCGVSSFLGPLILQVFAAQRICSTIMCTILSGQLSVLFSTLPTLQQRGAACTCAAIWPQGARRHCMGQGVAAVCQRPVCARRSAGKRRAYILIIASAMTYLAYAPSPTRHHQRRTSAISKPARPRYRYLLCIPPNHSTHVCTGGGFWQRASSVESPGAC